ncbi:hypothetical protein I302_105909 [Kwoniella bestiolae CBS 10118]|uniref:Uncharacterized protein n=1 Tax=Kwoniella bestiolae CBS 10118 TaxID=1296100 RepID=A0A1B9G2I3_9TREE|nr:hypothetical protein I302_05034 [Kwoniella bestiolae CBS 10118]OCF25221.1 hypothetical protein I302_05034 [Kwoniella bestiolae CBS 10118]
MSTRPLPKPIPIPSLLPSSFSSSSTSLQNKAGPSQSLPSPSYILGPLPPTSPLHIALNYLKEADERPYTPGIPPPNEQDRKGKGKANTTPSIDEKPALRDLRSRERVLIVTGSKWNYVDALQEEDEDVFRNVSGSWEGLKRLRRVDIRSCPTPSHLLLLLTLLTESDSRLSSSKTAQPQYLESAPSVIILWDIAGMSMYEQSLDENEPPDMPEGEGEGDSEQPSAGRGPKRKFKPDVCLSDYMNILSAVRAAVDHLNTLHPSDPPTQLLILEPSLNPLSSLPILPPLSSENEDPKMPKSARERRVALVDCAKWIFGKDSIGVIHQISGDQNTTSHFSLTFERDKGTDMSYQMRKKRCPKARWSVPEWQGEEKPMGWRWEWMGS